MGLFFYPQSRRLSPGFIIISGCITTNAQPFRHFGVSLCRHRRHPCTPFSKASCTYQTSSRAHTHSFSFLYHSNTSAFSHVLPLCFRSLRLKMRSKSEQPVVQAAQVHRFQPSELMKFNFRLNCMPAPSFDMEKKVPLGCISI